MINETIDDEMGGDAGIFNVNFTGTFTDAQFMPNANYCFIVSTRNIKRGDSGKYIFCVTTYIPYLNWL